MIAAIGALLKFDAETIGATLGFQAGSAPHHLVGDIVRASSSLAWWAIPLLTFIGGLAAYFKTQIGNKNTWSTVNTLLEEYRSAIFDSREAFAGRPNHHERVTLFKYRKYRLAVCNWPWTGWMIPVARTGVATLRRNIPRFRCPLGDPSRAEGVAGKTFANNVRVEASNLPEVVSATDADTKSQYAADGFVTERWVQKKGTCASRSLLGIPIEVKGKPWGVIVVDSTDPAPIEIDTEPAKREFRILSKLLAKLLED